MAHDILLRLTFSVLYLDSTALSGQGCTFTVSSDSGRDVSVELSADGRTAVAMGSMAASEELYAFLASAKTTIPSDLRHEITAAVAALTDAAERVVAQLKYGLGWVHIHESLVAHRAQEWSCEGCEWHHLPLPTDVTVDQYGYETLRPETIAAIQQRLDANDQPLLALRHLHRARREPLPRHKWLDATIAAELAIKEFLIRCRPDWQVLLLELPSPPLHKLYGNVLESLGQEKSPYVKTIQAGAEKRNRLMHRPETCDISLADAQAYVHEIEAAVDDLQWRLSPDDLLNRRRHLRHGA